MRYSIWTSTDPLSGYNPIMEDEHYIDGEHNEGVENSFNLATYSYTYQNPIRYIDPNGKQVDVVDFIPFVGSGRDIYRGIRDGDMTTLAFGIGGMALDVFTFGAGGSLVKGGIKAGVKTVAKEISEQGVKQTVKKTLTKAEQLAINKAAGLAMQANVTKSLIKKFGEGNVKSQITARFKDGTKVVFDDVILENGKLIAINETKSGGAKLSAQQARFFEKGEAVTFVGQKAKKAKILGKEITNKSVKILNNGR